MTTTGKVVFHLAIPPGALEKLADAMRKAKAAMDRLRPILERESRDLYRGQWWKRGEGEPEWIADLHEPEWWNGGDEPPEWGCAA